LSISAGAASRPQVELHTSVWDGLNGYTANERAEILSSSTSDGNERCDATTAGTWIKVEWR